MEKETKSEVNLAMAAEIRAERAASRDRITVKELSVRAGIPYGTLNRILSGERDINATQIARIAVALGTTPAELTAGATKRLGGMEGLKALVSEVQPKNVTKLRRVEDMTVEELEQQKRAATIDPEMDEPEQFD